MKPSLRAPAESVEGRRIAQGAARNEDIPDHLLFSDTKAKQRAAEKRKPGDRYIDALVVEESKRCGLALDTRDEDDRAVSGTPHGQILRYLSTAEITPESRIRWGILTNGGTWRLYDYRSRLRAGPIRAGSARRNNLA